MSEGIQKSVHQKLINHRDKTGEQFNSLLIRYGLERLLYRLVEAGYGEQFVLKGAMLFALWHNIPGRPTRDIDLLGFGDIDHKQLNLIFSDACKAKVVDDGLKFDSTAIFTEDIRDDQEYHGIRVRLTAFLGNARIAIQVDVGFGDALTPSPLFMEYPAILDFPSPQIHAYHPATVVAEKFNAMIELGMMNSRLKDFFDIHMILDKMDINNQLLSDAIKATFNRRGTMLPKEIPLVFTNDYLSDGNKEIQWQAFLRRSGIDCCNLSFSQVVAEIKQKLWPVVSKITSNI
ncbi:MAG: nucleotidyl transferase AbiEii/AbiGii toxin family protein [Planctomycetota bacterium]|jgi:hypothetical protein